MNLTEYFDASLVGHANRPAIEFTTPTGAVATLTFGDVDARAHRMARELEARGIVRGDRVCVQLANGIAFIDIFLACARLGAIFVPMNVMYKERELAHIIGDADPRAVITDDATHAYAASVPVWNVADVERDAAHRTSERVRATVDASDAAIIIYTSGTTGAAKGAVLSHANLIANARNLVASWRITETDRYLAVLPLFHVHGLGNGILTWLASGSYMHLAERFDYHTAASLFERFKPTLFFGVPTIYVRLLDASVVSESAARSIGARARLFVSGSAPLPAHVHAAFRAKFNHTILERYGMSEALMIASNPYEGDRRAGTVGLPLPDVALRVVDEHGATVSAGDVGEVQVRSAALFSGYWRRDDATAAAFTDDWFRTGDLGALAPDGYLTLRGRRGDLIISGGFNIYPREIEELLLEDARVHEAAVVGMADAVRGEVPIAYIVADDALDTRELSALCSDKLASFKTPRAFVRVPSLPRTALGKVQKSLLPPWNPA